MRGAGIMRGLVADNVDPLKLGRLKVYVPSIYGVTQNAALLPWAWPCFPCGGSTDAGFFAVPEIGACVWVTLQWTNGAPDPSHPVWLGTWYPEGKTPKDVHGAAADAHFYTVIKNVCGNSVVLCGKPGGEFVKIKHKTGAMIVIDSEGNIILHPAGGKQIKGRASYGEPK